MLQFFFRNKKTIFIVTLLLVALTVFAKGIENKKRFSFFDRLVLTLFAYPLKITNSGVNALAGAWHHYVYLVGLYDENRDLQKKADELAIANQLLQEQADENKRLRELLAFRRKFEHKMLPAEIIGRDPSNWFKTILVDKGSSDNVYKDAGVITPDGVVGRVVEIGLNSAKVLLLTDVNSYVDAIIKRTRARGIVMGKGEKLCSLAYVLKTEDVVPNDIVVSSGINTIYPKGIIVGTVISARKDRGGFFQSIEIQPSVDFAKMHEVLIVLREQEKK
jgi:rod shape-determining protein MreC